MDQPGMVEGRPLPETEGVAEAFWQGAREGRLRVQRCRACGRFQHPPDWTCTRCGAERPEWVEASGRAALYSWTVGYPPLLPWFARQAPWPVVAVELEEGPRLVARLVDVPLEEYAIGMPLVADFERVTDDVTLIVFRAYDGASRKGPSGEEQR